MTIDHLIIIKLQCRELPLKAVPGNATTSFKMLLTKDGLVVLEFKAEDKRLFPGCIASGHCCLVSLSEFGEYASFDFGGILSGSAFFTDVRGV
jgi:hypothetical protein